jgi:hypothetical protein
VPPKELYSQVKGQRRMGINLFFFVLFVWRKIVINKKGGV